MNDSTSRTEPQRQARRRLLAGVCALPVVQPATASGVLTASNQRCIVRAMTDGAGTGAITVASRQVTVGVSPNPVETFQVVLVSDILAALGAGAQVYPNALSNTAVTSGGFRTDTGAHDALTNVSATGDPELTVYPLLFDSTGAVRGIVTSGSPVEVGTRNTVARSCWNSVRGTGL